MFHLKLYLATLIGFVIVDGVWLAFIARGFYQKHLGHLLRPDPNWIAAILFYLLFIGGLLVFAILPGLQADSARRTVLLGGFFGLVTYATYDLTNLATMKDWPIQVTVVDMVWGAFLAGSVSFIGFSAGKWMSP